MNFKLKLNITTLVTEILTIVVGILLALAANEWNTQRLEHKKLDAILAMVSQELEANIKVLEAIHVRNNDVLASMQDEISEADNQFTPGVQIRDTAWQTLLSSGVIENLDISLLKDLHNHYALLDVYKNMSYQTVQTILSTQAMVVGIDSGNKEAQINGVYRDSISLIVILESSLLDNMQQVLESLNEYMR